MNFRFRHKRQDNASSTAEERMWAELKQSLREQFPNPQRQGCPENAILRRLAEGKLPLAEAQGWLDHMGRCSECFREFEKLKAQASRRRLRFAGTAAAVLLAGLSAGVWYSMAHKKGDFGHSSDYRSTPQLSEVKTPELPPQQVTITALHLETPSTVRSGDGHGASQPLQHLPRKPVVLSLYLPFNEGAGNYEVQLLRHFSDSTPVLTLQADARLDNDLPVARIATDLSRLGPGVYAVRFRRRGGGWRYSRVRLQ